MGAPSPAEVLPVRSFRLSPGRVAPEQLGADLLNESKQPRKPISRAQIERVVSRAAGGVGLIFALQTYPAMLGQLDSLKPGLGVALSVAIFGGLGVATIATLVKKYVRVTSGVFAGVYLVALIGWPAMLNTPEGTLEGKPWLWYLCTVATGFAAVSFSKWWAMIYTFLAPIVYGIVRVLPAGGGADPMLGALDAVYAIMLGLVILIIITMLRQATAGVDIAQTNALSTYSAAVRQHATEVERVQVDSLVHDSVLAALLSAAAAGTPKAAELAATMAEDAIARLNEAGSLPATDDSLVLFSTLKDRIRAFADRFDEPIEFIDCEAERLSLPAHAGEALYAASAQAIVNSIQHAAVPGDPVTRSVRMNSNLLGGCVIEIADSGVGFDPATVPSERLGLRISIRERVAKAGGVVQVSSGPGRGTSILIEWPLGERGGRA
ncbi:MULTISPECIES: sensor histidine kinase [Cryobacterium]|uniref:sensor histidine kinase n=1 Tax=Cryobacterium TaxID=69578 RepID=UPI000CD45410|nr:MULTISPECIES: ATP-binding protein [Cryobacterium]POH69296.1 ATP-binding protein [Cryobacterium zongtaii]TFC41213.1 ATP-binding protein [Cryobacterium sp. TMN-39-2]